ncbi:MAG: hypothetical protein ACR2FN_13320 [Chitinophagaceae bacterium]
MQPIKAFMIDDELQGRNFLSKMLQQYFPEISIVVKQTSLETEKQIASGLNFPTAMTFGPDGKLYVSNWGIGSPENGQILQISFKSEEVMGDTQN